MSYQVFRVHRGSVLHVIHETLTGYNRTHGVYVLCNAVPYSGTRERGGATCPKCLTVDNPMNLSDAERSLIATFATSESRGLRWGGQPITSLHKKDLIDKDEKLTRRGAILAADWTMGPAPAADADGIVHARDPLRPWPRCAPSTVLDGFETMTVDRYARVRALDLHVTCVACVPLRRQ